MLFGIFTSFVIIAIEYLESIAGASGVHCSGLPLSVTNEHNTPLTCRRLCRSDPRGG